MLEALWPAWGCNAQTRHATADLVAAQVLAEPAHASLAPESRCGIVQQTSASGGRGCIIGGDVDDWSVDGALLLGARGARLLLLREAGGTPALQTHESVVKTLGKHAVR